MALRNKNRSVIYIQKEQANDVGPCVIALRWNSIGIEGRTTRACLNNYNKFNWILRVGEYKTSPWPQLYYFFLIP